MMELGVQLEDRGDESVWKLEDPAVLRRAHHEKQQAAVQQKIKKLSMAHSKKDAVRLMLANPAAVCHWHTLGKSWLAFTATVPSVGVAVGTVVDTGNMVI